MHTGPNNKRAGSKIKRSLAQTTGANRHYGSATANGLLQGRAAIPSTLPDRMHTCRAEPWQEPLLVILLAPSKRPHTCHTDAHDSIEHTAQTHHGFVRRPSLLAHAIHGPSTDTNPAAVENHACTPVTQLSLSAHWADTKGAPTATHSREVRQDRCAVQG